MTNEQKYKTPDERNNAFNEWCFNSDCESCKLKAHNFDGGDGCRFYWLALEAEEERGRCEMSNRQETIADIVAEMMNESHAGDASCLEWVGSKIRGYADRIEAAHQREVAELRACLKMAVVNARIARTCCAFGRECDSCGQSCDARKWNKVIEATKGGKQ